MNTNNPPARIQTTALYESLEDARDSVEHTVLSETKEQWKQELVQRANKAFSHIDELPPAPTLNIAELSPEEIAVLMRNGGLVRD